MDADFSKYFKPPTDYQAPKDDELGGSLQFPNLNSVEFRNRKVDDNVTLLPFYEIIEANEDQTTLLLATNSYNSRLWNGTVVGYERFADVGKPDANIMKLSFESNVTGIKFIDKTLVLFTTASGSIQLWSTQSEVRQQDGYNLFSVAKKTEHFGIVTGFTLLGGAEKVAVTGATDGCLKIWKIESCDLLSDKTYRLAHLEAITDIASKPQSSHMFATSSRDRYLSIWDIRSNAPKVGCCKNEDFANTACFWNNNGGVEHIYLGDDSGTVTIYDPRKLDESVAKHKLFDRPVYKFKVNLSGKLVGVLSQSPTLKVVNATAAFDTVYTDCKASDYVRDICWAKLNPQNNNFLSVGWSKHVAKHSIK